MNEFIYFEINKAFMMIQRLFKAIAVQRQLRPYEVQTERFKC